MEQMTLTYTRWEEEYIPGLGPQNGHAINVDNENTPTAPRPNNVSVEGGEFQASLLYDYDIYHPLQPGPNFSNPTLAQLGQMGNDDNESSPFQQEPHDALNEVNNNDATGQPCSSNCGVDDMFDWPTFPGCFDESVPTTEQLFELPLLTEEVPYVYAYLKEGNHDGLNDIVDYSFHVGQNYKENQNQQASANEQAGGENSESKLE